MNFLMIAGLTIIGCSGGFLLCATIGEISLYFRLRAMLAGKLVYPDGYSSLNCKDEMSSVAWVVVGSMIGVMIGIVLFMVGVILSDSPNIVQ